MKKLIVIAMLPFGALFADPVVTNMVHIGRTSIGYGRNSYPNGAESVSVGDNACRNSYRIHFSEFVGNFAGMLATNVRNCVAVGERALAGAYSCNNVIAIGTGAGQTMRYGTNVTMIGNHFFASEQANEMKISPYWCYSTNAPIWYKDGKMFLNATNGVYINRERYGGGGGEGCVKKSGDTMSGDLLIKGANLKVEPAVVEGTVYDGGGIDCANLECTNLVVKGSWASHVTIANTYNPRLIISHNHTNSTIDSVHIAPSWMLCYDHNGQPRCSVTMPGFGELNTNSVMGTMLLDTTAPSVISNTVNAGLHIERYVNMGGETEYVLMDGTWRVGKLTLEP